MFIKKLIIGFLSFYTIDVNRLQRRNQVLSQSTSVEYSIEVIRKKEQERRKKRSYKNKKWSERKKYQQKTFALKGTKAKDHRYSNQQKIRRMFRNT